MGSLCLAHSESAVEIVEWTSVEWPLLCPEEVSFSKGGGIAGRPWGASGTVREKRSSPCVLPTALLTSSLGLGEPVSLCTSPIPNSLVDGTYDIVGWACGLFVYCPTRQVLLVGRVLVSLSKAQCPARGWRRVTFLVSHGKDEQKESAGET